MIDDDDISHIECSPLKLRGHYNAIILAAKSQSKEARNIFSGKKTYYLPILHVLLLHDR